MSSLRPFTFTLSPSHPLIHTTALALSTTGLATGLYGLHSPRTFASSWGLPKEGASPLWLAFAGRNITSALILTTFGIQGKLREFGTCLLLSTLTAGIDGYVTKLYGDEEKTWVSFMPFIFYLSLGLG